MRLDDVEIKVGLGREQTAAAVQALNLGDVEPWRIYFAEDVTPGLGSRTPLLDLNVIIRAREKPPDDPDDVTVKFRPGRRSQLSGAWLSFTKSHEGSLKTELKIEEDWAGPRRTLAISLTADRPTGTVAGAADVSDLLTGDQRRLISRCAGAKLNLSTLRLLPPLTAMRWPAFRVPGPGGSELKVRAERWTIAPLDFLELSIVSEVEKAVLAQQALEAFIAGLDLPPEAPEDETGTKTKTEQVMQRLVALATAIPSGPGT
ncbi:hypothetical protein GCM10027053_24700 [Intrasporangium mesophilum]